MRSSFPLTRFPRFHSPFFCIYIIILCITGLSACANQSTYAEQDRIQQILQKKELTVVVADSGFGGLSIVSEAANRMQAEQSFKKGKFIFFNALFPSQSGYDSLPSRGEKLEIFNSALNSMQARYSPDIILVGCSTLSVLLPDTLFARRATVPVVGAVDAGVELIAEKLKSRPDSRVVIFGTQAVIDEGAHEKDLLKKGFLAERIVTCACPELVSFIEREKDSPETEMLIYAFVDEALQKLKGRAAPFYVSFNCTQFGYAQKIWEKAFQEIGRQPLAYLNPNPRLIDFLFLEEKLGSYPDIQVDVRVASMVDIPAEARNSLAQLLESVSPSTAAALRHYKVIPDLFEWEKYLDTKNKK